jgi:hypothetical protein
VVESRARNPATAAVIPVGKLAIAQFIPVGKLDQIIGRRFRIEQAGESSISFRCRIHQVHRPASDSTGARSPQ